MGLPMDAKQVGRKTERGRYVVGVAMSKEQYDAVEARRAKAEKAIGMKVTFTATLSSVIDAGLKR